MSDKWLLTAEDFKNAKILLEQERINPVNKENIFRAGIYCILSAAEQYQRHARIFERLLEEKLDTPERIINNKERLAGMLKSTRFPNTKIERIRKYALWYPESDLPQKIIDDINNCRKDEFTLRNRLAEEAPGIWYKGASFLLTKCGYENVVPVDIWMIRFLRNEGYEIKMPDYATTSGPKPKDYLEYEKIISSIAKENNTAPAIFQSALWSKHSTWNKRKR